MKKKSCCLLPLSSLPSKSSRGGHWILEKIASKLQNKVFFIIITTYMWTVLSVSVRFLAVLWPGTPVAVKPSRISLKRLPKRSRAFAGESGADESFILFVGVIGTKNPSWLSWFIIQQSSQFSEGFRYIMHSITLIILFIYLLRIC